MIFLVVLVNFLIDRQVLRRLLSVVAKQLRLRNHVELIFKILHKLFEHEDREREESEKYECLFIFQIEANAEIPLFRA